MRSRGRAAAIVASVVVAATTAVLTRADASAVSVQTTAKPTCGVRAKPPRPYAHVVWIFMENRAYGDVIGNRSAPFINGLARKCGVATNYTAITHPSLPNYLAATSGDDWGIHDDDPPSAHPLGVANIFSQVDAKRLTWRHYAEDAPGGCPTVSHGIFAVHHIPSAYYLNVRTNCARWNVPMSALTRDLRGNAFPAFAILTPNNCNNTHDCSVATGDRWLSTWVTRIVRSRTYLAGRTILVVTWDEDDRSANNHIPTVVVSPTTRRSTRAAAAFTHYSLLRTTEEVLGLGFLGNAKTARSMRAAFRL